MDERVSDKDIKLLLVAGIVAAAEWGIPVEHGKLKTTFVFTHLKVLGGTNSVVLIDPKPIPPHIESYNLDIERAEVKWFRTDEDGWDSIGLAYSKRFNVLAVVRR